MHETELYKGVMETEAMDERNRQLQQFVYIASHELQEPVRRILLYSDLINNNIRNKDMVLRNTEKIHSSARRMLSIIEEVLSFSKFSDISAGFTPVDLNEVMHQVMDDLDAVLQERDASVIINGSLPIVQGLAIQLQQLFTNLITNAIKYNQNMPKVTISSNKLLQHDAENLLFLKSGEYYQINVADNGIGFTPEQGDQLFTMFKRMHDEGKYAGTGVGLALCKKIAENHGGAIKASSTPSQGSVFTIYLPA
jgi:signal transduction histidine kinase